MTVVKITHDPDENINSSDIQICYEHLYSFLMDFLWEFPVVQDLANLELAIFKRFPDKEEMQKCLAQLKHSISATYTELADDDKPEFEQSVYELEQAIEDYDEENTGCELYAVEEVIDVPEKVGASDDLNAPNGKQKFEIGNIKHTTAEERALQEEAANTLSNPFEEEGA